MKSMTCECGQTIDGSSENDVVSKMNSHLQNEHADRGSDHKKMMNDARKTMRDTVAAM